MAGETEDLKPRIDLIPNYFGQILYDIYIEGKWYGSRRTVEQCYEYIKYLLTP